jgi:hypothetical protein
MPVNPVFTGIFCQFIRPATPAWMGAHPDGVLPKPRSAPVPGRSNVESTSTV